MVFPLIFFSVCLLLIYRKATAFCVLLCILLFASSVCQPWTFSGGVVMQRALSSTNKDPLTSFPIFISIMSITYLFVLAKFQELHGSEGGNGNILALFRILVDMLHGFFFSLVRCWLWACFILNWSISYISLDSPGILSWRNARFFSKTFFLVYLMKWPCGFCSWLFMWLRVIIKRCVLIPLRCRNGSTYINQ